MSKRKTPPALAEVIMYRQPEVVKATEERLRVKALYGNNPDHIAEWLVNKTEAEIVSFMEGYNACLEAVMHEFNCYAGFHWYGPEKDAEPVDLSVPAHQRAKVRTQVRGDDPEFRDWRKLYYTNGIAKK